MSFRILVLILKFIVKCRKSKPFGDPELSLPIPKIPSILVIDKFKLNSEVQLRAQELLDDDGMKLEELCTKLAITYL